MSYWLKMIGAHDYQLEKRPFEVGNREELVREVRFPAKRTPRDLAVGDVLVYYAVGYYRIFAITRVDGLVVENVAHPDAEVYRRWPDAAPIKLGPHVEDLAFGPELKSISPSLFAEIQQGTTILPMGRPEYDRAEAALRKAITVEQQRKRLIGGPT